MEKDGIQERPEQANAERTEKMGKKWNGTASVCVICVTALICVCILSWTVLTYKRTPSSGSSISATGSASVDFESDLIKWKGTFMVHGTTLETAYEKIRRNGDLVKKYLLSQGITEDEMLFGSVDIQKRTLPVYDEIGNYIEEKDDGYDLYQTFEVSSGDLDKVEIVSRDISELIASGVELTSMAPQYYCSTLDEVKMELIRQAAANARERIELMAQESGAKVGSLTSANLGVFQITAVNSGTGDYGATGSLDTSSRYKTAMITVRLNYMVK